MCWWWGAACVPLNAWSSCASRPVICLANLFVLENVAQTLLLRETWHPVLRTTLPHPAGAGCPCLPRWVRSLRSVSLSQRKVLSLGLVKAVQVLLRWSEVSPRAPVCGRRDLTPPGAPFRPVCPSWAIRRWTLTEQRSDKAGSAPGAQWFSRVLAAHSSHLGSFQTSRCPGPPQNLCRGWGGDSIRVFLKSPRRFPGTAAVENHWSAAP